jgi:hypothetical protein
MRPIFREAGLTLPKKLKISCGWPSRKALASASSKSRSVGQCWPASASADGTINVFVSPAVADKDQVLAILAHELCHAALFANSQPDAGHGPAFRSLAERIGLTGKMTETVATEKLTARLNVLTSRLGNYPHATLDMAASGTKKQGTRMLKIECPECGWTARATRSNIDAGLPTCQCGSEISEVGSEEREQPE